MENKIERKFQFKKFIIRFVLLMIVGIAWLQVFQQATSFAAMSRIFQGKNHWMKGITTHTINSPYQQTSTQVQVLVPDNLDKNKRYPVLYILPTVPQSRDFWWNSGIMEAVEYDTANDHQVICVYPTYVNTPWFGDHPTDIKIRQESHLLKEIIPFIDKNYPTIPSPDGRLLLGISKSGCGAFTLLLRYPGIFGKACAFDAPLMYYTIDQPSGLGVQKVFGTEENFKNYLIPKLAVKNAHQFKGKPARFILMGHAELGDHVREAHELFTRSNIPHVYENKLKWLHNWQSGWFPFAVRYLMQD